MATAATDPAAQMAAAAQSIRQELAVMQTALSGVLTPIAGSALSTVHWRSIASDSVCLIKSRA